MRRDERAYCDRDRWISSVAEPRSDFLQFVGLSSWYDLPLPWGYKCYLPVDASAIPSDYSLEIAALPAFTAHNVYSSVLIMVILVNKPRFRSFTIRNRLTVKDDPGVWLSSAYDSLNRTPFYAIVKMK